MLNTFDGVINAKDYSAYVVKNGDSLYKIAMKHNISVEELKEINSLVTNTIYPNQILLVPRKNISSNIYQTVEGDTLRTVFKKLKMDPKCLKCYEPIFDVLLVPNQVIELVGSKTCMKDKSIIYMGEDIEEFLMNNEINPTKLIKSNNWLTPGTRVRIG